MRVFNSVSEMQDEARANRQRGVRVGFVPTMGALHGGHLSLIERSVGENDVTALSIFVNPTQFNDQHDLDAYPRTLEDDLQQAEAAGVDVVFVPEADEMYAGNRDTVVMVGDLTGKLCGLSRGRSHFVGVCTVVTKLFNIIQPDIAYFGQKDAQQALVIQRMVRDLNMPLRISLCPIVREDDGLAMSSRNTRIPDTKRESALCLYRALCAGRERIREGEDDAQALLALMAESICNTPDVDLDYLNIVDPETLEDTERIDDLVLIAGAIVVGGVRLIDNILVGPDGPWEETPHVS